MWPMRFIVFEGCEGAGKSTLIEALAKILPNALKTREPGGSPVSEQLRAILIEQHLSPITELFLMQAARAEHMAHTILPALAAGRIVLCDRFTESTIAYQGHARGIDLELITLTNRAASENRSPDLTIYLAIDPAQGLARARNPNRFEQEGILFAKKVHDGYMHAHACADHPWLILDGTAPIEINQKRVLDLL